MKLSAGPREGLPHASHHEVIELLRHRPLLVAALVLALLSPLFSPALPAGARSFRPGPGYWLAAADGGVFAYGRAHYVGAAAEAAPRRPVSGIVDTPSGKGYWLVGEDGGVFAFGDAPYLGGISGLALNRSVVGIAATRTGKGYWLAAADGGVFAFGDAPFHGSAAGVATRARVVAIAATRTGKGYWLAAADGGVFAFGDARFHGSLTNVALQSPVVGIAATHSGRGYWLATADGGVFAFGDARFLGSAAGSPLRSRIVGISGTRSDDGYWLAAADGGVFAFGDAEFYGAATHAGLRKPVVGIAAGVGNHTPSPADPRLSTTFGWDISWPQCDARTLANLPRGRHGYAIVGVTRGHLYSVNECLVPEYHWAADGGTALTSVYINTNYPYRREEPQLGAMFADACGAADLGCQLYQYGLRGARQAVRDANDRGVQAPLWWLDVETVNRWSPDPSLNRLIIQGVIDGLEEAGIRIGVYSTYYQWRVITGDMQLPGVPLWIATGGTIADGPPACTDPGKRFAGGEPHLVQFLHEGLDGNVLCAAGVAQARKNFRTPPPPPVPEFEAGPAPLRLR